MTVLTEEDLYNETEPGLCEKGRAIEYEARLAYDRTGGGMPPYRVPTVVGGRTVSWLRYPRGNLSSPLDVVIKAR